MLYQGKDMKYAVPFGPFLSIAAVAYLFMGEYVTRLLFLRY
jgi:leader peptidase (prepilin peptidase)/N-methyltransferase